eukprot:1391369-Amphidinium_carterae.1
MDQLAQLASPSCGRMMLSQLANFSKPLYELPSKATNKDDIAVATVELITLYFCSPETLSERPPPRQKSVCAFVFLPLLLTWCTNIERIKRPILEKALRRFSKV